MSAKNALQTYGENPEFVAALVREGVRFLVVGGLAVKHYCPDREVSDLDLLIEPTLDTTQKVRRVLGLFGISLNHPDADLTHPNKQIRLNGIYSKWEFHIDLLTPDADLSFDRLWANSELAQLDSFVVRVTGIIDTLTMKKRGASEGRRKDAEDVRCLEAIIKKG